MPFQVVRVQFDQAGDKEVPVEVDGARNRRGSLGNVGKDAVADDHGGVNDFVSKHDPAVGQDGLAGHHATSE